ncbi:hypothetical protein HYU23_01400 [Candidatus Woesearchaeota archaeon]|nr:hypothetical protein [Candidatus Woesearchaeota archaeon]
MNPRLFSGLIGRLGHSTNISYDLVYVAEHQRFFGFPEISGKIICDVFDDSGKVKIHGLGAMTIRESRKNWYNAVLYKYLDDGLFGELDRIEGSSYLVRKRIEKEHIFNFRDKSPWNETTDDIYVYEALKDIPLEGRNLQYVRRGIAPNKDYLEKCRNGLRLHSCAFRQEFERTTFLIGKGNNSNAFSLEDSVFSINNRMF